MKQAKFMQPTNAAVIININAVTKCSFKNHLVTKTAIGTQNCIVQILINAVSSVAEYGRGNRGERGVYTGCIVPKPI